MANDVIAEAPPMPQPEANAAPSATAPSEIMTASVERNGLAELRQRLAQEQFQLPKVQFKPRPRRAKGIPILHSEF
jgi:hypothetical protein